jgi:hypothetical protein
MALVPLIWIAAALPGIAAAWLLFMPTAAERSWARVHRRQPPVPG